MSTIQDEALDRARTGQSLANYPAIVQGFLEKGIPAEDIHPRENILTFQAWKAMGRSVKKGEHGVHVLTFRSGTRKNRETGELEKFRSPWFSTVFHVSQTKALGE